MKRYRLPGDSRTMYMIQGVPVYGGEWFIASADAVKNHSDVLIGGEEVIVEKPVPKTVDPKSEPKTEQKPEPKEKGYTKGVLEGMNFFALRDLGNSFDPQIKGRSKNELISEIFAAHGVGQ